jgi:SAM-dependent methyltransferase
MLFDETRNRAYLEAMRAVITPDTVVLDVGAGIGVLGLLAAKAGARHVYCVEPSSVAQYITPLAEANGVGDRVTAIQSRIEEASLPEQVDLILSVFTGNLLFTEDLLPSLYHARDRWLKPGGVLLPDRARLYLCAVEAGDEHARSIGRYHAPSLGIDYGLLAGPAANALIAWPRGNGQPVPLTPPLLACEVDFATGSADGTRFEATTVATRPGTLHALLGWIEIRLGDAWLSTAPDQPGVHWSPMLLPFRTPVEVEEGDEVGIGLRYVDNDQVFWSMRCKGLQQRQSPVLDNPQAMVNVMLSSAACQEPLGEQGQLLLEVLQAMERGESNASIAQALLERHPQRFADQRQALRSVGRWAAGYRARPASTG